MKTLVLDIEAIRDPSVWTPPEDDPEAFAPPYGWRPICVGCVLFERGRGVRRIGAISPAKDGDADAWEHALLVQFADMMRTHRPHLVTWNGRAFDLPCPMLRSMRHGLPQPWWFQEREYRYRYSDEGHLDLCDNLADFGAAPRLRLDGVAKLIGLQGKFGDIGGKDVEAAFAAGRHREIADYCVADAVQTAFIGLRRELLRGGLDITAYRSAAGQLLDAANASDHLGGFAARVDRRVLMLEGQAAKEAA